MWTFLVFLHFRENSHPSRVKVYRQYFDDLNLEGFDFTNGLKCSDVHAYKKLNNLSKNMFKINFYQDGGKWKHDLILIESSKNEPDKVIEFLKYCILLS